MLAFGHVEVQYRDGLAEEGALTARAEAEEAALGQRNSQTVASEEPNDL